MGDELQLLISMISDTDHVTDATGIQVQVQLLG
jgi:hypothetical protein